jgi:hypothetical protein
MMDIHETYFNMRKDMIKEYDRLLCEWIGADNTEHAIEIIEDLRCHGFCLEIDQGPLEFLMGDPYTDSEYKIQCAQTVTFKIVKIDSSR